MEHTVTSIQFNRTVKLQSRFSRGWFFSLVQKGVVSRSTVLPQSSRVHNGAQHRAWLIILGNDRFPIFIFKRIIPGKQEEEGTRKRCVRVVRQFFWTGSTGRVAAAFFFSCGKGLHSVAAGHSGKRGHFTGLCVSIHLPWTRLTLKYTSLPRTYLEKINITPSIPRHSYLLSSETLKISLDQKNIKVILRYERKS